MTVAEPIATTRIVFSFSGMASEVDRESFVVDRLHDERKEVASEIGELLSFAFGAKCEVRITFEHGSVLWHGIITFFATAPAIVAMANVGGAIAFLQMIGGVISGVVKRRLGPSGNPTTNVLILSGVAQVTPPQLPATSQTPRSWLIDILIVIAALCSFSSLVIAVIHAVQR